MSEDFGPAGMAGAPVATVALATTGASVTWVAIAGAATVLLGIILVRVARRRSRDRSSEAR